MAGEGKAEERLAEGRRRIRVRLTVPWGDRIPGEVLTLPVEVAQALVADGRAVAVGTRETAAVRQAARGRRRKKRRAVRPG